MLNNKDLSIIIPLFNEDESLHELKAWLDKVLVPMELSYEIIFVDDGSRDKSWTVIEQLLEADSEHVRGLKFKRNYGKSAALYCGFEVAEGDVVITMDADMQDSPDEIPALYAMIRNDGYDLVSGWKKKRHDPWGKTIPSKLFNRTARVVSSIKLHDFNCGLKAYSQDVIKSIEVYGEMHRYIPILAKRAGFDRIGEKVVEHRARKFGKSKFGFERMIRGFLDLLTVTFISRFGKSPMYFFGSIGTIMFLIGGGTTVWLIGEKFYNMAHNIVGREITQQPIFFIAILAIILGVQLFLAGFLAELISRSSSDRNKYIIDKKI